jgi:hypothetical protein
MKIEQTECSETSAYKIQTPGNYPEENIQHTEQNESLNSKVEYLLMAFVVAQLMNVSGPIWPQAFKSRSCDPR